MTRRHEMEFERPVLELERKIEALRRLDIADKPELAAEIEALAAEVESLHAHLWANLTPWARVQISRHPQRPRTQDYIEALFSDVIEVHGDRTYGDDQAIFAGFGTIAKRKVVVLGHRKGKNTRENIDRNFGSPSPEGFRKAMRVMRLADRFGLPIVSFLDTAGAYPGIEAEERGQAFAIAESLAVLAAVRTPVVVAGIGEGGSGGALAIGFGDRLIMLENAYYSVISPEACASILYKDASRAEEAAASLKMTASDLVALGIADEIVAEPPGGAHHDPGSVVSAVGERIIAALDELVAVDPAELVERRYARLRAIGVHQEVER